MGLIGRTMADLDVDDEKQMRYATNQAIEIGYDFSSYNSPELNVGFPATIAQRADPPPPPGTEYLPPGLFRPSSPRFPVLLGGKVL